MPHPLATYRVEERIAFVTLNNPGRRNALSSEMMGGGHARAGGGAG